MAACSPVLISKLDGYTGLIHKSRHSPQTLMEESKSEVMFSPRITCAITQTASLLGIYVSKRQVDKNMQRYSVDRSFFHQNPPFWVLSQWAFSERPVSVTIVVQYWLISHFRPRCRPSSVLIRWCCFPTPSLLRA